MCTFFTSKTIQYTTSFEKKATFDGLRKRCSSRLSEAYWHQYIKPTLVQVLASRPCHCWISWTRHLDTKFDEIWTKMQRFSCQTRHLVIIWWQFCFGFDIVTIDLCQVYSTTITTAKCLSNHNHLSLWWPKFADDILIYLRYHICPRKDDADILMLRKVTSRWFIKGMGGVLWQKVALLYFI